MKLTALSLAILFFVVHKTSGPNKEDRLRGYLNSMEYGCYYGITVAIANISDEDLKEQIRESSLKECPKKAKEYKKFIENN